MRALLLVLGVAVVAGQQFPEDRRVPPTSVLLASSGKFQAGGRNLLENQFRREFQEGQFLEANSRDFQQNQRQNYRGDVSQQTAFRSNLQTSDNQNRFQNFDDRFQSGSDFLNRGSAFTNQRQQDREFQFNQNDRSQRYNQDNRFQQQNQNRFSSFEQENQNRFSSSRQENQNNRFGTSSFGQNRRDSFNQERSSQFQGNSFLTQAGDTQNFYEGFAEPLNLPSGASLLMGQIDTSFSCADRPYGYYADQGNGCRVFHVCNPYLFGDGRVETHQYSFMCGEGRIFDQEKLTCVEEFSALSCQEASNFYFRNEDFGRPEEKF